MAERGSAATCRNCPASPPPRSTSPPRPFIPFIEKTHPFGQKKPHNPTKRDRRERYDALLEGCRQGYRQGCRQGCHLLLYLTFFLGRRLLVCPHFFLRQLTARGCRRA